MNTQKLTQKSIEVIQNAQTIASENNNQQIEQSHILYSLLTIQDSLIKEIFKKMNVPDEFEKQILNEINKLPKITGVKELDKISMQTQNKNSVTIYLSDKINPTKVFKDTLNLPKTPMKINTNSDIIILGVCLINIKKECNLEIGIDDMNVMEIRPSLFS